MLASLNLSLLMHVFLLSASSTDPHETSAALSSLLVRIITSGRRGASGFLTLDGKIVGIDSFVKGTSK